MAKILPFKKKEQTVMQRTKKVVTIHRTNLVLNFIIIGLIIYFLVK